MVDQAELIVQYRSTSLVMRQKVSLLKLEKQKKLEEIDKKQKTNSEFLKLEQSLEILQEGIQSLSLEIFKEKTLCRKLRSGNDWTEEKAKNSEELKMLMNELFVLSQKNEELKQEKPVSSGDSKFAQLEYTNPKLYTLVKRMIMVEEKNYLLKEEFSYLEQEKNRVRAEYFKITNSLEQEGKNKVKVKRLEKEVGIYQSNRQFYLSKLNDLTEFLSDQKQAITKSDVKDLKNRICELETQKNESSKEVEDLTSAVQKLESEILSEKNTQKKTVSTDLKKRVKDLEQEIIEINKELKQKTKEKANLKKEYETKTKTLANSKQSSIKNTKESFFPKNQCLKSSSSTSLYSKDRAKREALISILSKNVTEARPNELKNFLKKIGTEEQGIASKLVSLNRDEFLKKLKLSK